MKLFCVAALAAALSAQTPSFEAASIKPTRSPDGPSSTRFTAGQMNMENVAIRKMTLMAYGIPDDRVYALIGPSWLGEERFDIVARYPGGTPQDQVRLMLQHLLAERFKLALHRETRQLPEYALVLAKSGPRMQPADPGQTATNGRPGHLEATKISMQKLADLFAKMTAMPVANETGLSGVYSFTLEWAPEETARLEPDAPPSPTGKPSLYAALQDQLGLKLEGRKAPVEVLVVDHIDRAPSEN
jgi:uncharacterized protein (TIGR03435 family)